MEPFDPLALHKPPLSQDLLSPTISHQQQVPSSNHASSSEQHLTQAQAASMRRKKNADAQAAFRLRRANYIASLEETVTSLEAVVLSLQDTCREARNGADDLRHENTRLLTIIDSMKQAARDREKEWRDFWHSKQQALGLDETHMNDLPPRAAGTPPTAELHPSTTTSRQYVDEALRFQTTSNTPAGEAYPLPPGKDVDQRYPPGLQPFTANPEGNWIPGPFSNTRTPCIGEQQQQQHPSQSSEASDSPPSISPGVQYNSRYPLGPDDNRMSLVNLSMSNASYGRDSSSPFMRLLVSDAPYSFPEGPLGVPEYSSDAYSRHALSENERYSGRQRRAYSGPNARGTDLYGNDTSIPRATSPLQMTHAETEGLNGDGLHPGDNTQGRPRRNTYAHPTGPPSHSPSSSPPPPRDRERGEREPPMSNTLAVIKAQAFGSLRRTRTRTKKASDSASKVAIDILAARGIGMGVQVASPGSSGGGVGPGHRSHGKRKGENDNDVEMGP